MGLLKRFVINSIVVWPMLGLYMLINHHRVASPNVVLMPSWVLFCPAFLLLYIAMLLTTWLLPVTIHDAKLFRACIAANLCGYHLVMPWWYFMPTMMPRPPFPEGSFLAFGYEWLWQIDMPTNITPCAHGIGPFVAAWFAGRDHPKWRWALVALLTMGLPSIALTWQHRPIDILLGLMAAAIGVTIGEFLNRSNRESPRSI